jgi:uncharacterized cupin superfamily protein
MAHFNLDRAELEPDPDSPERFNAREASITDGVGGEHLGGSLLEIPPGGVAWPYHWEAAQEEWLIVLSGTPTVRTPDGEETLAPGDVVCFPVGPEGAHQVSNASEAPCRIVMLSNRDAVNVIAYPDSGKVGVRTPWMGSNFLAGATVGYWEGE